MTSESTESPTESPTKSPTERQRLIWALNQADLRLCTASERYQEKKCKSKGGYPTTKTDPISPHQWGALSLPPRFSDLTCLLATSELQSFCCISPWDRRFILLCGSGVNPSDYERVYERGSPIIHHFESGEHAIIFQP